MTDFEFFAEIKKEWNYLKLVNFELCKKLENDMVEWEKNIKDIPEEFKKINDNIINAMKRVEKITNI